MCPEARHRSRSLEFGLDAVDDRNILGPCHALHVPQYVAASLSEPVSQMICFAPSTETAFAYMDYVYPDTQVLFWNNLFLDELLVSAEECRI